MNRKKELANESRFVKMWLMPFHNIKLYPDGENHIGDKRESGSCSVKLSLPRAGVRAGSHIPGPTVSGSQRTAFSIGVRPKTPQCVGSDAELLKVLPTRLHLRAMCLDLEPPLLPSCRAVCQLG